MKLTEYVPYAALRGRYGDTRSRDAIRKAIRAGKFPTAYELSPGRIGFRMDELDKHYANLPVRICSNAAA